MESRRFGMNITDMPRINSVESRKIIKENFAISFETELFYPIFLFYFCDFI